MASTVGLSLATGVAGLVLWNAGVAVLTRAGGFAGPVTGSRLAWQEGVRGNLPPADFVERRRRKVSVGRRYGRGSLPRPKRRQLRPRCEAWFIIPVGTPLVIDLAMVPAFLLMLTSLNWLFRLATGLSGLGHFSWLVVALAATPLIRMSSLVSGDLWFTAAYLALTAVLVTAWSRQRWTGPTVALAALATGLLAGSKTSGSPAAALLLGTYVGAETIRFIATRRWPARPGRPLAPSGLTLAGIPIFEGDTIRPTTYLSVLGDQQAVADYDVTQRLQHYARQWLGRSFLVVLWLALLIPVDLALTAIRRRWTSEAGARSMLLLLVVIPGLVLLHLLAGAPWTSLEWTRGFSLRYALPVIVGVALTSAIGALPLSVPWYRDPLAAALVIIAAASAAGRLFLDSTTPGSPRFSPMPPTLLLQTPDYRSQVFYAGRDVTLAERAGPLGACDYVIASPAMMETDKGPQLLAALAGQASVRRLWASDQLVVYGQ